MSDPVTYEQFIKLLSDRDEKMQKWIKERDEASDELYQAHRDAIEERLKNGSKSISQFDHDINGNGKEGLKTLVDRLVQSDESTNFWMRTLGGAFLTLLVGVVLLGIEVFFKVA